MSLYSFESPNSIPRLVNKIVLADTSYLVTLYKPHDTYHQPVLDFHEKCLLANTAFQINDVIRQELLKEVYTARFVEAVLKLANANPTLYNTYRDKTGIKNKPLSAKNMTHQKVNEIYKHHVKQGDQQFLLNAVNQNIWQEVEAFEQSLKIGYVSGVGGISWDELGRIIQQFGLTPTDAMIVNFALFIEADAIVTKDVDFAVVESEIDVYMPKKVAESCGCYDASLD